MVNTSGSEDGQLRSPNDGHYISGDDDEHDADALYIQPPQPAASSQGRGSDASSTRREKKKHSRDRRHKEQRSSLEGVERERDRRERERDRFEYARTRDDLEQQRYHQHHQQQHHQHRSERAAKHHLSHAYHYQQQLPLPPPPLPSQSYAHHHHYHQEQQLMGLSRSGARAEYYHSSGRHVDYADVEQQPPSRRASKHGYEQPKDAESLEQDLRSRLLSKRHKYVKDYESEENYEQPQQSHSHSRRKERDSRRSSHSHKMRHGQVIELLDSPETAAQQQHQRHKQHRRAEAEAAAALAAQQQQQQQQRGTTSNDPELLARREKILAAERENRQRRQIAREELEARREQLLRERNEHSDALSPTAVAASVTAGLNIVKRKQKTNVEETQYERRKRSKQSTEELNKQSQSSDESESDEEDDEEESGSAESGSDSAESEESNYEQQKEQQQQSHKKHRKRKEQKQRQDDDDEDVPLPDSPLSVGALYKSPKQRARSRSASSSKSSHSQNSRSSRSRSRSRSRSHSSRSRSSEEEDVEAEQGPRSRSSSTRSEERGMAQSGGQQQSATDTADVSFKATPAEELPPCDDKGIPLPNYYPGVQGCRSVEEFQCLNRIEEGTYGVVYRAKDKRTNEIVALKRLKMEKEKEGFPITSLREINTLLKGQHPNIVTVREIVVGSNMDKIFIVMDYVEHDLKSLMETMKQRKQSFFPGEVKCLAQQLLLAVAHLHDNWILHRDLKTSNLLLSHKGILKVGDFGLAREYGSPLKKYTSLVVTLWYRAPELLLCSPEYSTPIDVWSVGCIFAEFLQMAPLFPGKSEIDELNRIFKELGTPNEKIWPGYLELPAVKNMLSQNSQFTDYPVSQLRKHFQDKTSEAGLALLQGLLTYDPKQRLTADAALKHAYFKELPLPIDPSMFPTWPAKSELGARKAQASSPKPPSGGSQFKQLGRDEPMATAAAKGGAKLASGIITGNKKSNAGMAAATAASTGFVLNAGLTQRQMAMGPGFSLKF
ncbi:serine/threonine-protein kinase PITSLRE isoform X1 [Drosophila nasuta]|uniref:serine/threonine-protein kinase PITSLRE isoform X1 n=2 Tax=Drosophila nasuta TaxID=42062 RepID=UPI00295E7897|nr:serine/threonine-protein kinase PITSLRE isoform X1 [Drosophila nasuta]